MVTIKGHEASVNTSLEIQAMFGKCLTRLPTLKGNSGVFKPRPYFWHEIRSSAHREQFGESRRPSEDI